MNPALHQLLETHYRKQRRVLVILGGICAAVMVLALGIGIFNLIDGPPSNRCSGRGRARTACVDKYEDDTIRMTVVFTVIPGIVVIIAGIGLFPLRVLTEAPLFKIFGGRRDEVAWIYPKRTSVRRYGVEVRQIHEVVVGLRDGKRIALNMTEEDVKTAIRLMGAEAPRAERGYTPELDAQFKRDPTSLFLSAPQTLVSGPGEVSAPLAVRLVVAPDFPFARIDTAIRYLGLTAEAAPAAPTPIPGEPTYAAWTRHGGRVAYRFEPRVYLRVLELSGNDPARLRSEIAGVVGVPVLAPQQALGMMGAQDARTLLLGVLAAEALGVGEERRQFQDAVARLQGHPDPAVAQEAQRVYRGWA